jgi:hypothetical protein
LGKEWVKKIRIGLVCYKDKADKSNWEKVDLDNNLEKFHEVLGKHLASGGGDPPEDVKGAFKIVLDEMSWLAKMKFVILITDAPGHGKIYHDLQCIDDYPDENM